MRRYIIFQRQYLSICQNVIKLERKWVQNLLNNWNGARSDDHFKTFLSLQNNIRSRFIIIRRIQTRISGFSWKIFKIIFWCRFDELMATWKFLLCLVIKTARFSSKNELLVIWLIVSSSVLSSLLLLFNDCSFILISESVSVFSSLLSLKKKKPT